uniref:Uncharacterized protein n=1 Tax=Haemonchus contortus TaxID=6289 RepID=W6NFA9_HAECO
MFPQPALSDVARKSDSAGYLYQLNDEFGAYNVPKSMPTFQTRRDIWRLINSTHFNNRTFFFTSSSIEECEQLSDRYGVLSLGHLIAVGTVDALRAKHTRLCVLQLVVEEYARKKVVDGIREIYANSVPLPVPDSGKGLLKWQVKLVKS